MSNEPVPKTSRGGFLKWIDRRLTKLGFAKDPEKDIWTREHDMQAPTQTIVINGQRMDQPGETHHMKFVVDVYGEGELKDIATEVVENFIQVDFNVLQDGSDVSNWPTFCIFFDDQILFNDLLNKIFEL